MVCRIDNGGIYRVSETNPKIPGAIVKTIRSVGHRLDRDKKIVVWQCEVLFGTESPMTEVILEIDLEPLRRIHQGSSERST